MVSNLPMEWIELLLVLSKDVLIPRNMSTIAVGNGMHHASTVAEENPCRAKEENEA